MYCHAQFCYLRSDFQESEICQHIKSTEVRAGGEKFSLNPQFQVKPKANQVLYDVNPPDVAPQSSNESCVSKHTSEAQRTEVLLLTGSTPGRGWVTDICEQANSRVIIWVTDAFQT